MTIKLIKKGRTSSGREYIVIEYPGNTLIDSIIKKFGLKYAPGLVGPQRLSNGLFKQILWKREQPKRSLKEVSSGLW
jgi:hypothetical protein